MGERYGFPRPSQAACRPEGARGTLAPVPMRYTMIFLLLFLVSGCGSGGKVAAVVNGQLITERDVNARLARLNPAMQSAFGGDRRKLIEEMVMETVLLQEARRRGLERDPEVGQLLRETRRQILVGRLLELVRVEGPVEVGDQEIARFYEENKVKFREPETFRASHVLVVEEGQAKAALARIKAGEPFAKVAEELSIDQPTRKRGGDIGFFAKGQLIPEFEAACQKMEVGQISPVVKSTLGYHIILLAERRPERDLPLEEVKERIRRQLAAQRQQERVGRFVQGLRGKAQIQITEPPVSAAPSSGPAASSSAPAPPPSS